MRILPLAIILLLPMAAAHGAPEAREIDERILTDTTSSGDYGGPEGVASNGGLDLLALDVHEGTVPGNTTPALVFRVIVQGGEAADHRIDITGEADGEAFTLDLQTSDLTTYTSETFPIVRGPFDVGDGHPKAIEGIIPHSELGISPGDELTDIILKSHKDDGAEDAMPGSWYVAGEAVPLPPTEEAGEPGTYTTQGPLRLFEAETDADLLTLDADGVQVNLTASSLLSTMEQTVTVTTTAPEGVTTTAGSTTLALDADGSDTLSITVSGQGEGEVRIFLESDLGYAVLLSIPIEGNGDIGLGGDVASGNLAPGESYQYTFTAAGTLDYHCHPHPWMQGHVTIHEISENQTARAPETHVIKAVEPSQDDPKGWYFEPSELSIMAGDTVVWVNDGQMIHDVRGSTGLGDTSDHGHDHDHAHGDEDTSSKDTPAPFVLIGLLAALVVAMRRH